MMAVLHRLVTQGAKFCCPTVQCPPWVPMVDCTGPKSQQEPLEMFLPGGNKKKNVGRDKCANPYLNIIMCVLKHQVVHPKCIRFLKHTKISLKMCLAVHGRTQTTFIPTLGR